MILVEQVSRHAAVLLSTVSGDMQFTRQLRLTHLGGAFPAFTGGSLSAEGAPCSPGLQRPMDSLVRAGRSASALAQPALQTGLHIWYRLRGARHGRLNLAHGAARPHQQIAADFTAAVAVNLAGSFHISQQAASRRLQAGSGHTVTATIAGQPTAAVPAVLAALAKRHCHPVDRHRICRARHMGERRLAPEH